jgi:hypothetical protein
MELGGQARLLGLEAQAFILFVRLLLELGLFLAQLIVPEGQQGNLPDARVLSMGRLQRVPVHILGISIFVEDIVTRSLADVLVVEPRRDVVAVAI